MNSKYKYVIEKAGNITPTDIFKKLTGKKKFLLESTFQHELKGKYSFIGQNPYLEIIGDGQNTAIIHLETGEKETVQTDALTYIKQHFPVIDVNLPLPFFGGVGFVSYDAIRQFEQIGKELPDDIQTPDIHFMFFKSMIAIDHTKGSIYFIVINVDDEEETVLNQRLCEMKQIVNKDNTNVQFQIEPCKINLKPEISKSEFMQKVVKAKQSIYEGDIFQVVLSQRMSGDIQGDPFSYYLQLRKHNPSPYMFYIDFGDYLTLGTSPESLVQTNDNEVITNPIAGTRARGKTRAEDEQLMHELLHDEKEIAEHRMLVDLSRNDLGRVCEPGTLTIPTYMEIEKYQHVMHIVSEVKGRLRDDVSSIDALIACLPAGTVSGAPKVRAMQIINELEDKKRGIYSGGVGFIDYNCNINFAIAIRSLIVKDGKAYLQAGAGIVHDSIPELEYEETLNKARSLMEVARVVSTH